MKITANCSCNGSSDLLFCCSETAEIGETAECLRQMQTPAPVRAEV